MQSRSKWPPLFVLALFTLACGAALLTPDAGPRGVCIASAVNGDRTIPDIAGTWEGTWEDTVYFVSSTMSWTITQDGSNYAGSGTIDMTPFAWAGLGSQEGGASGSITREERQSLSFSYYADLVGLGDGVLTGDFCTGSGVVNAPLDFGFFTFQGTVTDTSVVGRFFFTAARRDTSRPGDHSKQRRHSRRVGFSLRVL